MSRSFLYVVKELAGVICLGLFIAGMCATIHSIINF